MWLTLAIDLGGRQIRSRHHHGGVRQLIVSVIHCGLVTFRAVGWLSCIKRSCTFSGMSILVTRTWQSMHCVDPVPVVHVEFGSVALPALFGGATATVRTLRILPTERGEEGRSDSMV